MRHFTFATLRSDLLAAGLVAFWLVAMFDTAQAQVPADTSVLEARGQRLGDIVAQEAQAWDADLVVVGTHGRRGIGRALLGSGAEQIIRTSPVPVLSIRGSTGP